MTAFPHRVFHRLIDDAAMFPPGNATVAEAVAAHRQYGQSWFAPLIGPLVVSDQKLAEVGQAALRQAEGAMAVSVVNTSGAGGLVSLASRDVAGVKVVSVESALRDLDDLAGNATRVVNAAAELDDTIQVFVELPYAPGWERAVAEVEAAGLCGKLRTGGPDISHYPVPDQLARQLSVLIEADLPFKATAGLHRGWPTQVASESGQPLPQHGFLNLLLAVEALIEGASEREAAELLELTEQEALVDRIGSWSDAQSTRVRHRLISFGCCGVLDPIRDLVTAGLIEEPA